MIFSKLPNEIIHQIYDYDSTYHDKYKNCIKELNGLIKCYPNNLPEIIISSSYYQRYNTIYSINQENISHYNKYILYILNNNKNIYNLGEIIIKGKVHSFSYNPIRTLK